MELKHATHWTVHISLLVFATTFCPCSPTGDGIVQQSHQVITLTISGVVFQPDVSYAISTRYPESLTDTVGGYRVFNVPQVCKLTP